MIEIERKFLVLNQDFISQADSKSHIIQGYLNSDAQRTVRIRVKDDKGFLTIKGIGNDSGTTRLEWETEIPSAEAKTLLSLAEKGVIDKVRHLVKVGNHTFEVDVFAGENAGLIIAELELEKEDEQYQKPDWLGEEVTGIEQYYNAYISNNPFSGWK